MPRNWLKEFIIRSIMYATGRSERFNYREEYVLKFRNKLMLVLVSTLAFSSAIADVGSMIQPVEASRLVTMPKRFRHHWRYRYSAKRMFYLSVHKHYCYFNDMNGRGKWIKYKYVNDGHHNYGTISVNGTYEPIGLHFKSSQRLVVGYDISNLHFYHK